MRLSRTDFVPVLAIVASGAVGLATSASLVLLSSSDDVPASHVVVVPSAAAVTSTPTRAQTQDDVVIVDNLGFAWCPGAAHVTSRLVGLFTAINSGESASDIVAEYFGGGMLSVNAARAPGHEHFAGYDGYGVERYLGERYAQNEHLELQGIQFNRINDAGINFGPIEVVRRADDLPEPYYKLIGGGAYDCDTQRFTMLGLGTALNEEDFRSMFGLPF